MLALTWNLGRKEKSLRLACDYLAAKGTCVACFQEPPAKVTEERIEAWSGGALAPLTPLGDKQRLILLVSRDLRIRQRAAILMPSIPGAADRMVGASVGAAAFEELQVVGVHLHDLRNLPRGKNRFAVVRDLAVQMRLFWTGGPLIVLGDFNAHPFDEEIALRTCLWATRDKAELGDERELIPPGFNPAMDVVHQGVRHAAQRSLGGVETLRRIKPLYNPMWRWLPERDGHPRGTYYRKHDDSVVTWQCTDQILVSPDLAHRIERVDILDRMGSEVLVEPGRVMMNRAYGDHLPVELTLEDGGRHERAE